MTSPADLPPADPKKVAPSAPVADSPEEQELTIPATLMSVRFLVIAVLSVLVASLLVGLVLQMRKVSNRDQMLANSENRAAQVEAGLVQLRAQIEVDKANTDRLRQKLNEATRRATELAITADKLAATSAETQKLLERARAEGARFQTDLAGAKVASLEQKGIAEIARAGENVMQVQLKQATEAAARLQQELTASKAETAALRDQLQKAEALIANQPKPTGKR